MIIDYRKKLDSTSKFDQWPSYYKAEAAVEQMDTIDLLCDSKIVAKLIEVSLSVFSKLSRKIPKGRRTLVRGQRGRLLP